MLIGIEKKFLFVANTKTASTSIEKVLVPHSDVVMQGNSELKHSPLAEGRAAHRDLFERAEGGWDSYFKFGVMREPFDWISSWFRYRRGNQVESPLPLEMTFADFWARKDWNLFRGPQKEKNLQRRMFVDAEGKVLADVIIPYHRVAEYFPQICDQLGIPRGLPRENVSTLREMDPIPEALHQEMLEHYAEDYVLWNQLDQINAAGMARLRALRAAG